MCVNENKNISLENISICVFGGASLQCDKKFLSVASEIGSFLGKSKAKLVYGAGSTGVMGAFCDSAIEAGGCVTGVLPDFMKGCDYITCNASELLVEKTMHHRKKRMYDLADIFSALPGGIGTLDEIVEVLVWADLSLHKKHTILFNYFGYFDPLIDLLKHMIKHGFASSKIMDLFSLAESKDDLFSELELLKNNIF